MISQFSLFSGRRRRRRRDTDCTMQCDVAHCVLCIRYSNKGRKADTEREREREREREGRLFNWVVVFDRRAWGLSLLFFLSSPLSFSDVNGAAVDAGYWYASFSVQRRCMHTSYTCVCIRRRLEQNKREPFHDSIKVWIKKSARGTKKTTTKQTTTATNPTLTLFLFCFVLDSRPTIVVAAWRSVKRQFIRFIMYLHWSWSWSEARDSSNGARKN